MSTEEPKSDVNLTHVHRCAACGALTRRSHLSGRDSLQGLYECPACGNKGPLNVEIVDEKLLTDSASEAE